jgi:hypothetical protein
LSEERLTEGQRKWLQASREIGPGAMTKSERLRLEKLYADLLPAEQQELQDYIKEHFGSEEEETADPIEEMARRAWRTPSEKLRKKLGKTPTVTPPRFGEES